MSLSRDDFSVCLAACLDGTATSAERELLVACLRSDPIARAAYVRQLRLDTALRFVSGQPDLVATITPPARPSTSWTTWTAAVAAAAAVIAIVLTRSPAPAPDRAFAVDWPTLVERPHGSLFGQLPTSDQSLSTQYLLPTHLLVQLP